MSDKLDLKRPAGESLRAASHLVVISHGSGGRPETHSQLACVLRGRGLAVEVPLHEGNNRLDNRLANTTENFVRRPQCLREVIDRAGAERVVIVGHSLGGYTGLVLAGGVTDLIADGLDERVVGVVLMAPSVNWFRSLERVRVPVLLFTGGRDTITPRMHGEIVTKGVPHTEHVHIPEATHYSFLSPFPEMDAVDREAIFTRIADFAEGLVLEPGETP